MEIGENLKWKIKKKGEWEIRGKRNQTNGKSRRRDIGIIDIEKKKNWEKE